MELILIDKRLEDAIDNTDMGYLRKRLYKRILHIVDERLQISKTAVELIPSFIKSEDIKKIKENLILKIK